MTVQNAHLTRGTCSSRFNQQSTVNHSFVVVTYSAKGLVHCFLIGEGGGMLCLCSVIQLSLCLA